MRVSIIIELDSKLSPEKVKRNIERIFKNYDPPFLIARKTASMECKLCEVIVERTEGRSEK